jgi:hypothetical protein
MWNRNFRSILYILGVIYLISLPFIYLTYFGKRGNASLNIKQNSAEEGQHISDEDLANEGKNCMHPTISYTHII